MLATADVSLNEWSARCRYWADKGDSTPTRKRRERRTEPLVLTGHGLSIRVDKGCLVVKPGNTHFPALGKELRFFRGALDLPPRIVAVDGSGTLTLDAMDWLAEQGIAFVRINYDGTQAIAFSPTGYAADPANVAWQLETRNDPKRQLAFAIQTTKAKLEAALETLTGSIPNSRRQQSAIDITGNALSDLTKRKPKALSDLLGIEGKAALAYWSAWRDLSLNWKAEKRQPIPDEWKSFNARASVLTGKKWKNWRASNPINAMLNYAYAALLTEMRIKAIADGFDPMLGILHDQRHKGKERTPSFALDLMEPLRPIVDRAVLKLISEETFSGADFLLQSDGVCRLNSELAKAVALRASQTLKVRDTVA